eukprot:scaffold167_cov110-Cylindrotheca_fusiformis.AAC.7
MSCSNMNAPLMTLVDAALSDSESSNSSPSSEAPKAEPMNTPIEKLSFAQQLMTVLDDESCPYLVWMPDGKSFTIKNPKEFTTDQMPKLFNIRNMSSFVRKLSRWGFNRYHERETMNSDLFRHKDFQKGNWKKCSQINCSGRPPVMSFVSRMEQAPRNTTTTDKRKPHSVTPVPVSPTISTKSSQQEQEMNEPSKAYSMTPHKTFSLSSQLAEAALQSFFMEQDLLKALSNPSIQSKLFALQLMKAASQQQQHSFHALLQSLLAQSSPDDALHFQRTKIGTSCRN